MKQLARTAVLAAVITIGAAALVWADSTVAILDAAGHVVGTTYGEITPDWCYNGASDWYADNDGHIVWLQCTEGTQYVRQ